MISCFLAIGSNIGDLKKNLDEAVEQIKKLPDTQFVKKSDYLSNAAYGVEDQADFLNGVVEIKTALKPKELLFAIKEIEKKIGRKKTFRWGPRVIDIDIILYGDLVYQDDLLEIPHKDMKNRNFVLFPLAEIAPDFEHPVFHKTIAEMAKELE